MIDTHLQSTHRFRRHLHWLVVVASLLILAFLYIRTVKLDLPYRYHVDEDYFYISALQIRQTGLQPNVFYPPLSPYLTSLISLVMDVTAGGQSIPNDVTNSLPTYFAARLFSVFATLLAGCFLYLIGKKLHSVNVGIVLLWLFGSDPQVFAFAYQIRGDAFAYLFMGGSLYFALVALENRESRRAFWLSLVCMVLAMLGKYSVAPLAIFPGYLLLRRVFPSVRRQLLVVSLLLVTVLGAIMALRTWGQPLKRYFELSGFLFLFTDQPFNEAYFRWSFGQLQANFPPLIMLTLLILVFVVLVFNWKALNTTQRYTYVLLIVMVTALLPIMAMLEMRYRDLFVLPYALYILWTLSLAFLTGRLKRWQGSVLLLVIGFGVAIPAYLNDVSQSDYLRLGDVRADASRWLETHVHQPSKVVKEYTVGDFLPHVNGYQGGYLAWTVTPSILDKKASDWWDAGIVYAITDSRQNANSWFFGTDAEKSLYKGFSLAYQTPDALLGPGPRIAIFYTFDIQTPDSARLGDLAEVFGYNIDAQQICSQDTLSMRVFLRALRKTDIFYEAEIVLRDTADGAIAFSDRQTPALGSRPTTVWEPYDLIFDDHRFQIPAEVQPGTYQIELALYEPYHQERVPAVDKNGNSIGDTVPIGQIELAECAPKP